MPLANSSAQRMNCSALGIGSVPAPPEVTVVREDTLSIAEPVVALLYIFAALEEVETWEKSAHTDVC